MKKLFKMNFDCGRMGSLQGVFVATQEQIECLIRKEIQVYFGEVLGKHSEILGPIEKGDITMISDNPDVVNAGVDSGYDPFEYTFINFDASPYGIENTDDMTVGELVDIILEKEKQI